MNKSEEIKCLANELNNADRDIAISKMILELPFTTITIYNASNEKKELDIPNNLRKPLADFLQNYFNKEKEKTYKQMNNILDNNNYE
jgi:hypothetical protein